MNTADEQTQIQLLLQSKLTEYRKANPRFSIRALARKLTLQASATNEILRGERRVSRKLAEKITRKLGLDPSERSDVLRSFPEVSKRRRLSPLAALKINSQQFSVISEWTHFAILSLMQTSKFKSDPKWIGERFGITELEAKKALEKLESVGLIAKNEHGKWIRTSGSVNTSDDTFNLSLQRSHFNDMDLARAKLGQVAVDKRDFTSFTFPVNPKLLPQAKEILRKTQDDLDDLMAGADPQEIYRLCMYLFPLTGESK